MTAALEPCPNPECGSAKIREDVSIEAEAVRYECRDCGLAGPSVDFSEENQLAETQAEEKAAYRKAKREARRLWNALPRPPRWTSEPPKVPGDYLIQWWRSQGIQQITINAGDIGPSLASAWGPQSMCYGPIPQPPSPAERSDRP